MDLLISEGEGWDPFHEQHGAVCIAGTTNTLTHDPTKHSCCLKGVRDETKTPPLLIREMCCKGWFHFLADVDAQLQVGVLFNDRQGTSSLARKLCT